MWKDAAMLTASAVLFVQMGLSDAIQHTLRFESKILSCPRCLTFWAVLSWSLLHGCEALPSLVASFICAYSSLWLALAYDAVATIYNKAYDKVSAQADTAETNSDAVPKVQP